jgi:hypothetical protein
LTIKIQQAVWWHAAAYSPSADATAFDPVSSLGGMSSLRLDGTAPTGVDARLFTTDSPGVLAGKFCDTLRSFTLSVQDQNLDGQPDTVVDHPTFGVRMGDPTLLDARVVFNPTAAEAQAIFGAPKLVLKLEDFVTSRVPLSYMLMAVYNSGLSLQCTDRNIPDEWFAHENIPGDLADPVSVAELKVAMAPKPQRTSDGHSAGFFVKFAPQQDVRQLGCCGVVVGGGGGSSSSSGPGVPTGECVGGPTLRPWTDTPSRTRIWAVRAGVRGFVSPALSPQWSCFGPTPQELVYAEFDDDTKLDTGIDTAVITWHHAGFVVLEDNHGLMFPTDFSGTSADDSFNLGNAYDYQRGLPVDIVDIAWDDRGWLWGMCTGPSRTEGNTTSSPETTVDGIYRILPGGWSYQRADTISFGGHFVGEQEVTARLVQSRMGGFSKVACGDGYTLYLTTDGHLEFVSSTSTPQFVPPSSVLSPLQVVTDIAASSTHAACILQDGTLMVWSMGGTGDYITGANGQTGMVKVSCGDGLTCTIGTDGNIHAFGASFTPPVASNPPSPFVALDCGSSHIGGLTQDERLIVSGSYTNFATADTAINNVTAFACGDDCTLYTETSSPSSISYLGPPGSPLANPPIASGMEVVAISAADLHAVALAKSSGCVACSADARPWGIITETETGMPLTRGSSPLSFDGQQAKFVSVSCGKRHTCLVTDGTLLEPRYSPARLVYRSKISLASGVSVPDEPAAVMTKSSNTGSPLAHISVYDDSTILLGDSDYKENPFDFSERVGLKIYDQDTMTIRVLGANWRPHRLRADVTFANQLTACTGFELQSQSHLVLPPTSDMGLLDHVAGDPSLLTVMQLPELAGAVNFQFGWNLDSVSFATRIYPNVGPSAAIPQSRPDIVSGSSAGVVIGVSNFTSGGYSSASAVMPQRFIAGQDVIATMGSQIFMRNDGVDTASGSSGLGWPQVPSICAYRALFDEGITPVGYTNCSVGREYLVRPDGSLGEIRFLSSSWRLRAAIPKATITIPPPTNLLAPFTSEDTAIGDSVVDMDYRFDDASVTAAGLTGYGLALGGRSVCMAAPNLYPNTSGTCVPALQWMIDGTTVECLISSEITDNNAFISSVFSNSGGFSSAEGDHTRTMDAPTSTDWRLFWGSPRTVGGCDLVDSRPTTGGTLCASVGLGIARRNTFWQDEQHFSLIETRWTESPTGAILGSSSSPIAREVIILQGGVLTPYTVQTIGGNNNYPESILVGSQSGAFIWRKQADLGSGSTTDILYLPKDPEGSISTNVEVPRVLANQPWEIINTSDIVYSIMVADGGPDGVPFFGAFVYQNDAPLISLKWILGGGGRFSGSTTFANRWANAVLDFFPNVSINLATAGRVSAAYARRDDSNSDVVIVTDLCVLYLPSGGTQFQLVAITDQDWNLVGGLQLQLMHTPSGNKLIAAQAGEEKVDFFEFVLDAQGHPTGQAVRKVGTHIHGTGAVPRLKANGNRLMLQFPPVNGDPRHLVLEISEITTGASTSLAGELKAATLIHAQPAPLRDSVSPEETQTAAPFMYYDGNAGATVTYPSSDSGSTVLQDSLPDERLGAFASMPARFHPQEASGGRYFVENTNKAFRVYEPSTTGLVCKSRVTDSASLQSMAPGSLNDAISPALYRSNGIMPQSAPWGNPYSSIAGVYGKSATAVQRVLMVGDTLRVMAEDGTPSTTEVVRAVQLPTPLSWITEMNARSAKLNVSSGQVQATRPELVTGTSPYRRVKARFRLDGTLTVPFGGATPISVSPVVGGADLHAWAFWGKWLFRIVTSGIAASVQTVVEIPETGVSDHFFSTWFHSPTGSGDPAEGYSDYLDGYVTAASSAAGLVVANSRCHHMSNRTQPEIGRMEIRFFSYQSGTWTRTQNIVLNNPLVMGEDVGMKYHQHSYLPQRISMALSDDGKILAVAGHRWTVNDRGMPQNTQVVIFKRTTAGFVKASVISAADVGTENIVGDFAGHMEIRDEGAGLYTLNISCALDPVGAAGTDIGSMAASNRMVSYSLDINGTAARVAECNDLLPAGEAGFTNSAAANLNHWVASPSPAYNGTQSAAWSGQKLTITTLNRILSLQSDRSNWRVTDHVSRPYRYTDAKVLAVDFAAYKSGFTCPATPDSCGAVTDLPQLPSPAGGHTMLDGRVRAAFFIPQTVSALNDTGFYQIDNSGDTGSGWWDGISSDPQISALPHLSHVSKLNGVQRSTTGGEATWNPSTGGSIRIVPLSGSGAGVPSPIGGSFSCTVRRPLFAARGGTNRLDWPFIGALQVQPKHLVRFQDDFSQLRSTPANSLDLIDAGTVSLTRNASNIIVLKDGIDRSSSGGTAIPFVQPILWSQQTKNVEDLGQLVSLRINGGSAVVRSHTSEGIFPETTSPRVSPSSQRFGIKRPMAITVGGSSACGAGSFDIARPARSPIAPLEGRAGGRGGSPWLLLVERHGIDDSYFNYGIVNFGARGLSGIGSTLLRHADPFMVRPEAPFDPVGHVDRMGWCDRASYPLGGNSTSVSEAIIEILRGILDPDNGSVFNGDRIGVGTTDGYAKTTPPTDYTWAFPNPSNGSGTTVRCLCKSTVFDAYEWFRKTFRLATSGISHLDTALRVLHGQGVPFDPTAPFYSRFNEDGSPLRSLVFILTVDPTTGNSSVLNTSMGSVNGATRQVWAQSVFDALRTAEIIEANGSIHFIDMVKRDLSDPYRRACETLAEVSGGSYISLGRQEPALPS